VSQPDLAAQRAVDLIPHIILLDDALGNTGVTSLIRLLSAAHPQPPSSFWCRPKR